MDITKFNEKLNKLDNNFYTIEEVVTPVDGVYEADLEHDNVNPNTINIYTGSKLTGDKINTYTISIPSLTPWKTHIKIFSNEPTLYITYETVGDTVEADDINNVQDAINLTQESLNGEITRATNSEIALQTNINNEVSRATSAENTLTNNLNTEINRAKNAEKTLTTNLNNEITRAKKAESDETTRATNAENDLDTKINNETTRATNAESTLQTNINNEVKRAKDSETTINNIINTNKPNWDDKYTRNEIDNKISKVITDLDWKESVNTYADLSTTYPNPQDGWTVNVKDTDITYRYSGSSWVAISANSIPLATSSVDGKMSKDDKSFLDIVRSKWNSITTHISDTIKHITSAERTLWNTVSNKSDKGHTHTKSEITDMPTKVSQFTNDAGYIKSSDSIATSSHTHSNKAVLDKINQSSLDNWNNKLSLTGGTVTGITLFNQGTRVINLHDGAGTEGYMYVAQIKITKTYQDQPITFKIHQRYAKYGTLVIIFKGDNGLDPELKYIHKIGNINAYIYKSATSTWELYLPKADGYDSIDIIELNKGEYIDSTTITWINKTVTSLPSGCIQAITEYLDLNVNRATNDSEGKQINTTYVKKGMTWNQLEGI